MPKCTIRPRNRKPGRRPSDRLPLADIPPMAWVPKVANSHIRQSLMHTTTTRRPCFPGLRLTCSRAPILRHSFKTSTTKWWMSLSFLSLLHHAHGFFHLHHAPLLILLRHHVLGYVHLLHDLCLLGGVCHLHHRIMHCLHACLGAVHARHGIRGLRKGGDSTEQRGGESCTSERLDHFQW